VKVATVKVAGVVRVLIEHGRPSPTVLMSLTLDEARTLLSKLLPALALAELAPATAAPRSLAAVPGDTTIMRAKVSRPTDINRLRFAPPEPSPQCSSTVRMRNVRIRCELADGHGDAHRASMPPFSWR
jgi:hypothetical protein